MFGLLVLFNWASWGCEFFARYGCFYLVRASFTLQIQRFVFSWADLSVDAKFGPGLAFGLLYGRSQTCIGEWEGFGSICGALLVVRGQLLLSHNWNDVFV